MAIGANIILGDPESMAQYRADLLRDYPEILTVMGLQEQADNMLYGRYDEFVEWFTSAVAVGQHGIAQGGVNLTRGQSNQFMPYAQKHGLVTPSVKLWTPMDELPSGVEAGEIVSYSVLPDYDSLPDEVFASDEVLVQGATLSGMISRIDAGIGAVVRSDAVMRGEPGTLTVQTGMRKTRADEGDNLLYREFLPEGMDRETPIQVAFPMEVDSAEAILRKRCRSFVLIDEVEDPDAGNKPPERTHPELGSRTWIARTYDAVLKESGIPVVITIVNGEPIAPKGNALNRSRVEPAPEAPEIFKDWLKLPGRSEGRRIAIAISFAHLIRIAGELYKSGVNEAGRQAIGHAALLGSMPQQEVWYRQQGDYVNGGTLTFKEFYPVIKAINELLGRDPRDLSID